MRSDRCGGGDWPDMHEVRSTAPSLRDPSPNLLRLCILYCALGSIALRGTHLLQWTSDRLIDWLICLRIFSAFLVSFFLSPDCLFVYLGGHWYSLSLLLWGSSHPRVLQWTSAVRYGHGGFSDRPPVSDGIFRFAFSAGVHAHTDQTTGRCGTARQCGRAAEQSLTASPLTNQSIKLSIQYSFVGLFSNWCHLCNVYTFLSLSDYLFSP